MAYLSLKNVNKIYSGGVQAVFDFNLDVEAGEFIVLVGPSGCGKSTTLRMVAGLEGISAGDLTLDGKRINDLAPQDRGIAMVFQDYALYGNMTVYQNIGFSMTVRHKSADEIHDAVMRTADIVHLREYLNRYPGALSGGQKQRVAMGRSIARGADVLLMDEPLSNLDAKLRQETRRELTLLHKELRPTILYVTHDQTEAMTMATRMVVMKDGYVQQIGTPQEIYHSPANVFTAGFIGMPPMNILKGTVEGGVFTAVNDAGAKVLSFPVPAEKHLAHSGPVLVGIRPEHISHGESPKPDSCTVTARVSALELLGSEYNAYVLINGVLLTARINARCALHPDEDTRVSIDCERAHFFDAKTEGRLA